MRTYARPQTRPPTQAQLFAIRDHSFIMHLHRHASMNAKANTQTENVCLSVPEISKKEYSTARNYVRSQVLIYMTLMFAAHILHVNGRHHHNLSVYVNFTKCTAI